MSAAATPAGAAPGLATDWHSIDWRKVYRNVRRLQARIVKAVREGRWGKVKALVYLLTHSFSGRALAILRVVSNSGARTSHLTVSGKDSYRCRQTEPIRRQDP
jgi:RNA-directed DNA polymerase